MKIRMENIAVIPEADLQNKPSYVTDERWERICRIVPMEDKKRSLLAGKLLDQMCKDLGIDAPEYGTEKSGKPVLMNEKKAVFNLSHSGEYVLLAYQQGVKSIGADIQKVRKVSEGLKKRMLHKKELEWFAGLNEPEEEVLVRLNRIWAIKESFVKMTGEGLAHDFRKLYVDLERKTISDENQRMVSYKEPEVPQGYVAAVFVEE